MIAWMIIVAGLPRWEIHAHDVARHGHAHSALLEAHVGSAQLAHEDAGEHDAGDHAIADDQPSADSNASEELAATAHLHDLTTVSATLLAFARPDLPAVSPDSWIRTYHPVSAPSAAGPPPHRPPIA